MKDNAQRQTQVSDKLARITNALARLDKTISNIGVRLAPVRQSKPTSPTAEQAKESGCDLANQLNSIANDIDDKNVLITTIYEELEI